MLSSKTSKYPNAFLNSRHPFCIRIRELSNLYSYSSKNVVKGVIRIRFHVNPICFHPWILGVEGSSFLIWLGRGENPGVFNPDRGLISSAPHLKY
jgi:hypothetical protein